LSGLRARHWYYPNLFYDNACVFTFSSLTILVKKR
jgi:hypothetical protein